MNHVDLAIIGSGSAAFGAAIEARRMGRSVTLVERSTIGGTCVNVGCVPSKDILAAAGSRARALHNPFDGICTSADAPDVPALVAGRHRLVDTLRAAKYIDLAAELGIDIVSGTAAFVDGRTLSIGDDRLTADRILIAAGTHPAVPALAGLDRVTHLTSTEALELTELPPHLVVIGANAVGLELGQAFLHLGSQVTFIDVAASIAPSEEPEVAAHLAAILGARGAVIMTGVTVNSVERAPAGVGVAVTINGQPGFIEGSHLLIATGRRTDLAGLHLDAAGVTTDARGFVMVDRGMRTSAEGIFAAGDVAGLPQFVYVAARSGGLAARNAFSNTAETLDLAALPRIVFTTPQIAVAGVTEAEARAAGFRCDCRVLSFDAVPRAIVNRDTRGVVKIVAEAQTGRVLGVSMLADGAADSILAAVYAIRFDATVDQLADAWAPYLTMAEGIRLAAQSFSRDVGQLSCCAA